MQKGFIANKSLPHQVDGKEVVQTYKNGLPALSAA
jgi:hypothetical protein